MTVPVNRLYWSTSALYRHLGILAMMAISDDKAKIIF